MLRAACVFAAFCVSVSIEVPLGERRSIAVGERVTYLCHDVIDVTQDSIWLYVAEEEQDSFD